mgnify:CR=1 FL=1
MKSEGLGDTIEKFTKVTGIKKLVNNMSDDCGCNKRKEKLNKIFPNNDVDTDPKRTDIIEQNNAKAFFKNLEINRQKADVIETQRLKNIANNNTKTLFRPGVSPVKEAKKTLIKKILPKIGLASVGKIIARNNPVIKFAEIFLGSQSAYAPNRADIYFKNMEKKWKDDERKEAIKGMSQSEINVYDNMEKIKSSPSRSKNPNVNFSQG